MTKNNWKKLLSHSVEEADILSKNYKHQKHIDCLEDYSGRVIIDGERETLEKRNTSFKCELKYEEEVLDLLDFNLPERDWIKVTSAKLAVFIQGASAVQIGKILSKLSDTDERIVKGHSGNGRFYYLPVKKRLFDTLKMNG